MVSKMKKNSKLIIQSLRKDGRKTLTQISKETGISISSIFENVRSLEKDNIIKKYVPLLNYQKLGYGIKVEIFIKLQNKEDKNNMIKKLKFKNCVNTMHEIAGDTYDFMLDLIFKNLSELSTFIEYLEDNFAIKKKQQMIVLEQLKEEGFIPE